MASGATARVSGSRFAPEWLTPRRSLRLRALVALAIYVMAAVYYSWPLVTDFGGTIYGSVGDLTGAISSLRELLQQHQVPFLPGTFHDFDAPSGLPVNWALNLAALPSYGLLWTLGLLFGANAAYGIYTLLGWVASAFAMYLLARRVTRSESAALIAGYAFGFYPFPVLNGQGHNDFVHGWPLVILIWRVIELRDRPSRRNGLLAGAAATLALAWTAYYLLIAGVVFGTLLVSMLVVVALRSRTELASAIRAAAWSVLPPSLYVVLVAFAARSDTSGQGVRTHTLQELIVYSARWYEYVVPPETNRIVGDRTAPFLVNHLHGSNFSESRLYVGVSCLLLGLAGLVIVLRQAGPPRRWLGSPLAATALTAAVLAIVAFVWSAPPQVHVLGLTVSTPSDFVFKVTSTFRAYSRFVIAVMAAVSLLAGIGIAAILRGRSRPVAVLLSVILGAVVVTDTWGRIHPGTNKLNDPAIYRVLRDQPRGIVAEYPLEPAGYGNYAALLYQQAHGDPILNGYTQSTPEEARALAVQHLDDPSTPGGLAALGVKYVLLTTQPVSAPGANPGKPVRRGLKFIARDSYAALYRVTAAPRQTITVTPAAGFAGAEGAGRDTFNWMTSPTATLAVGNECRRCRGVLTFGTSSLRVARRLEVTDGGGRVVARVVVKPVPIGSQRVEVPLTVSGPTTVKLRVAPGPGPAGSGDKRVLAVVVKAPRVIVRRPTGRIR